MIFHNELCLTGRHLSIRFCQIRESYTKSIISFQALAYLVLISEVEEVEIFKICLEYWNALCADLYRENPYQPPTSPSAVFKVAPLAQLRRQFYSQVLSQVK